MEEASIMSRAVAFIIDGVIAGFLGAMLAFFLGFASVFVTSSATGAMPMVVLAVQLLIPFLMLGYFVYFESRTGQTPGKRFVDIKVVDGNGEAPGILAATIRNILRPIDAFPAFYIVGIISIYLTEKSQRIGDLAGSTLVVEE